MQLPRPDVLQPFPLQGTRLELAEDIAEVLGLALQPIGDLVEDAFDFVGRSPFDDDHHLGRVLEGRRILSPMFMEFGLRIEQLGTFGLELEEKERVAGAAQEARITIAMINRGQRAEMRVSARSDAPRQTCVGCRDFPAAWWCCAASVRTP